MTKKIPIADILDKSLKSKDIESPKNNKIKKGLENQEILKEIIKNLGITQEETALILSELTGRSISYRAIKSWLANPELSSSRPCPEWPCEQLKDYSI